MQQMPRSEPTHIFIAYSHKDKALKDQLRVHLHPLLLTGKISLWDDHDIEAGREWEAEIRKNLSAADLILLLVSPDSLASDYFYGKEVAAALERHRKHSAKVVPVILRPCTWMLTPLSGLEVLPLKGLPVTQWPTTDEAFMDVALSIGKMVDSRLPAAPVPTAEKSVARKTPAPAAKAATKKSAQVSRPVPVGGISPKPSPPPVKPAFADPFAGTMLLIKGGTFKMGRVKNTVPSSIEYIRPGHVVRVRDFYLCKYPVTQAQWRTVTGAEPSHFKGCDHCPVESVSCADVEAFLKKLNQLTGKNYRLPTEAEWEYAACGGPNHDEFIFSGSDNIKKVGWDFLSSAGGFWKAVRSKGHTHTVGEKLPNSLGLYDMTGNVFEMCQDVWHDDYTDPPLDGSAWMTGGDPSRRVAKGGSWGSDENSCRNVARAYHKADARERTVGLRLACDA